MNKDEVQHFPRCLDIKIRQGKIGFFFAAEKRTAQKEIIQMKTSDEILLWYIDLPNPGRLIVK